MGCSDQRRAVRLFVTLALFVVSLFVGGAARAQPRNVITEPEALAGVVPELEVFEDPSRSTSIDDVLHGPSAKLFTRPPTQPLAVAYSRSAFWLRFTLENVSDAQARWLLELYRTSDARVYEVVDGRVVAEREVGASLPFATREVPYTNLALRLTLAPHQARTVLLRITSDDTLDYTPMLWSEIPFGERLHVLGLAAGLYYGAMFALIAYNLFLAIGTRARGYGAYVVFALAYALLQATFDRYLPRYVLDSPAVAMRLEFVFAGAMVAGAASYTATILDVDKLSRRLDLCLRVWRFAGISVIATGLVTIHPFAQELCLYVTATSIFFFLGAGIYALARGVSNARVYVAAWLLLGGCVVVDVLTTLGVVHRGYVDAQWLRAASVGEALLLAFALANRLNVVARERERVMTELDESRREYAATLEVRVDERTRELAKTMRDLERAQQELSRKERLAALGRLVTSMAHEIGNPLNFGLGGARELRKHLNASVSALRGEEPRAELEGVGARLGKAERALSLVEASNERLRLLVESLRHYVKFGQITPRPASLVDELESALTMASTEIEQSGVVLEKDIAPLPLVSLRSGELGQVFTNLIVNACQAMEGEGTLRVEAAVEGDDVVVVVEDSGPGVAPEIRDRIFEPFFTTRDPGAGTGLGLAISLEIVARHGGRLTLASSERGAAFEVRLPITSDVSVVEPSAEVPCGDASAG